ncbi:unnamed protein product [[Candida] boidinii]|nr:unnamed protein product [[Candida] boidinii]
MNGVYHQKSGNLVAASRSAKFQSVYSLPFLNLNNLKLYNQTKNIVIDSWRGKTLEEFDPQLLEVFAENSRSCEMITYLHFESTDLSESELKDIDEELINPLGRPYRRPPQVVITNGLVYSPDCGILVKINEARGPRAEIQDNYIKNLLLLFLFILLAQILLFIRQMGSTNTPSTMSRISFWTLAIMNLVDGSISMITLLCASIFTSLYIQFAVCAFLAFTCSTIFEMRYMIMIYATQMNERNISFRVSLQGTPIDEREAQREEQQQQEQQTPTTNTDTLLPVNNTPNNAQPQAATTTTTTPNNTITTPQDEQTIGGQMYSRTFIALIVFSFFILNTILLPKKQRIFFEYLFGILVNSYWIPQIYRNVIRGSRRSFAWEFIVGTSIIRLLPICYLCIYKGNPLYHHQDIQLVSLLISWVSLQIFVLFLQEIFGARFFLPEKYLPQSYDYHPVLSFKDLENGFGIGQVNVETNENGGISKCKVDCAICMTEFDIPVSSSSINDSENSENSSSLPHSHIGVSPFNIMARRTYMVTPCRHIFHTNCLESWMKYKLQCPVCRNSLPPL